jgi:hypothetical protein
MLQKFYPLLQKFSPASSPWFSRHFSSPESKNCSSNEVAELFQVCNIYCKNLARVLGRADTRDDEEEEQMSSLSGAQGPRYASNLVIPALTDQVSALIYCFCFL